MLNVHEITADVAMTLPLEVIYTLEEGRVKDLRAYLTDLGSGFYADCLEMTPWFSGPERERVVGQILEYERRFENARD